MNTDAYLGRTYHHVRYNCLHFARDVWFDLTGVDISSRLGPVLDPTVRRVARSTLRSFTSLELPTDPCIVLFERTGTTAHVGIYLQGKVLHLREAGAIFQPLSEVLMGFTRARFYVC